MKTFFINFSFGIFLRFFKANADRFQQHDQRRHHIRGIEEIFHRNGVADLRQGIGKCEVEERSGQ